MLLRVLLSAMLASWGHTLSAQTCFPGRPLPSCHSFPVTEIGYAHRLDKTTMTNGGSPQVHYFNGEIGWMVNQTPRLALGGTFFLGALVDYDFQLRPGLNGRMRYWLNDRTGLDAGAGVFRGRTAVIDQIDVTQKHRVGASGHLGLSFHDAALFMLRLEYLRNPIDRDLTGYLGARFGSKPAAWATVIVAPILALGALIAAD